MIIKKNRNANRIKVEQVQYPKDGISRIELNIKLIALLEYDFT